MEIFSCKIFFNLFCTCRFSSKRLVIGLFYLLCPLGRVWILAVFASVLIWEMLETFTVCVKFCISFWLIYILNKLCIIICFHSNGDSSYVLHLSQFRHNYPETTKSAIWISEKPFFLNLKFNSFFNFISSFHWMIAECNA